MTNSTPSEPSSDTTSGVFAKPWEFNAARWTQLLDHICEHRPWFDDQTWEDPEARRALAVQYLAEAQAYGLVWEVFRGAELVGVIVVNRLNYGNSGTCHFVFFDRQLANKRRLCLNTMRHLFETQDLQILRVEIPTYARALANWVRKKLGFRYEAEARPLSGTSKTLDAEHAALGSRKVRATLYKQDWHDLLLLSITREEFQDLHGHLRHPPTETGRDSDQSV